MSEDVDHFGDVVPADIQGFAFPESIQLLGSVPLRILELFVHICTIKPLHHIGSPIKLRRFLIRSIKEQRGLVFIQAVHNVSQIACLSIGGETAGKAVLITYLVQHKLVCKQLLSLIKNIDFFEHENPVHECRLDVVYGLHDVYLPTRTLGLVGFLQKKLGLVSDPRSIERVVSRPRIINHLCFLIVGLYSECVLAGLFEVVGDVLRQTDIIDVPVHDVGLIEMFPTSPNSRIIFHDPRRIFRVVGLDYYEVVSIDSLCSDGCIISRFLFVILCGGVCEVLSYGLA